jgi:hypothetical protein
MALLQRKQPFIDPKLVGKPGAIAGGPAPPTAVGVGGACGGVVFQGQVLPPMLPPQAPPLLEPVERLAVLLEKALSTPQAKSTAASLRPSPLDFDLKSVGQWADEHAEGATLSSTRRAAVARLKLMRAVRQEPSHFIEGYRRSINRAFRRPEEAAMTSTAREYLEHRSRLSGHKPTINWCWILAGALDALLQGNQEEATARLILALIAGEQVSLDGGSWQLAWELMFEEDYPPYNNFTRSGTGETRIPCSQLADPRWMEVALGRLTELDRVVEVRRRLAKAPAPAPSGYLTPHGQNQNTPGQDEAKAKGRQAAREKAEKAKVAAAKKEEAAK